MSDQVFELSPEPPVGSVVVDRYGNEWCWGSARWVRWKECKPTGQDWFGLLESVAPLTLKRKVHPDDADVFEVSTPAEPDNVKSVVDSDGDMWTRDGDVWRYSRALAVSWGKLVRDYGPLAVEVPVLTSTRR